MTAMSERWNHIFENDPIYRGMECDKKIHEFILFLLQNNIKSVLDIGCGCGRHLVEMKKNELEIIGVDHSSIALTYAKQALITLFPSDQIVLIKNDLMELCGVYNAILAWHVLGHGNEDQVMKNILKVIQLLNKNGVCLFNIPAIKDSPANTKKNEILCVINNNGSEAGIEHCYFSRGAITSLLTNNGCKLISIDEIFSGEKCYFEILFRKGS